MLMVLKGFEDYKDKVSGKDVLVWEAELLLE